MDYHDFLDRLVKFSQEGQFIYRGCDSEVNTGGMVTSLYREYRECIKRRERDENRQAAPDANEESARPGADRSPRVAAPDANEESPHLIDDRSTLKGIEMDIVDSARRHFPMGTKDIEIMTELRHYGQNLNIIDFTRNLFVALFFACRSNPKQNGQLHFLNSEQTKVDIDFDSGKHYLIEPVTTQMSQKRVIAQNSVFAHAPLGRIEQEHIQSITIEWGLKDDILDYLSKIHGITENTLFSDLLGLIDRNSRIDKHSFYCGLKMFAAGRYSKAVADFDQAISQYPRWSKAHVYRAIAHKKLGSLDQALKDINKADGLDRNDPATLFFRSEIHLESANYKAAYQDISRYIRLKPKDPSARLQRSAIAEHLTEDKFEEALADLETAIKLQPEDVVIFYTQRGEFLERLGRYYEAIECYRDVVRLEPRSSWAHYKLGDLCRLLKKHDEAIKHSKDAIQVAPDEFWGHYGLGNCLYDSNRPMEALPCYRKVLQVFSKDPPSPPDYAWRILGDIENRIATIGAGPAEKKSPEPGQPE